MRTFACGLASEREARSDRKLSGPQSGKLMLGFLTGGQERCFFDLHRFCSDLGASVFDQGKETNGPRVRQLARILRDRYGSWPDGEYSGADVIETHVKLAETV